MKDVGAGRDLLRRATQAVHLRLHRNPVMHPLLTGCADLASYRRALERLFGFHDPLERELFAAESILPWKLGMKNRRRSRALWEDLRHAGLCEEAIAGLPVLRDVPRLDTPGRVLGALYVREGSALGGKLMAAKLEGLLGAGRSGRQFLTGEEEAEEQWRSCCEVIEVAMVQGHGADMVTGAQDTFLALEAWLNGTIEHSSNPDVRHVHDDAAA